APSLPEMLHDASFCCTAQIQLSSLVSAVSLSSESLDSIYTMTLWKAEDLIRVSLAVARRAISFGFGITTGVVHDGSGQMRPLSSHGQRVLDEISHLRKPLFSFFRYNRFQDNLVRGIPNNWQCHAGSR